MIHIAVEQGSPEWLRLRLGIPTASSFDRIMTPKKLQRSTQAPAYRNQLLAEWLAGHPIDWGAASLYMDRGTELEPRARAWYELQQDVQVRPGGFVLRDDGWAGGSPDGLVGDDGELEIKIPAIHTHIGYLLDPASLEAEYVCQVQGRLYITGRAWCDMVSFNPDFPSVVHRVHRDEHFIKAFAAVLDNFIEDLQQARERLEKAGFVPAQAGEVADV